MAKDPAAARAKAEKARASIEVHSVQDSIFNIRYFPCVFGDSIAQVSAEAEGPLAGLFSHLAAESTLAAVRFIRESSASFRRSNCSRREGMGH